MDLEFEYHCKKHSGPPSEKDKVRNSVIDYELRFMKSYGTIMKTYHLADTPGAWTEKEEARMENTVLSRDFRPFLQYSKNKKNRWVLEDEIGPDMISNLQKSNDGIDVVMLERVYMGFQPFWFVHWGNTWVQFSKIGSVHQLETIPGSAPEYSKRTVKRKGNVYSSIVPPKKKSDENLEDLDVKVCYNFFTPPKSYKKMLHKDYVDWNCDEDLYRCDRKRARVRLTYDDIEYELLNQYCGYDILEDIYYTNNQWKDVDFGEEIVEKRRPDRCYDLTEHIVDRFVIVKKLKNKNKNGC